MIFLRNLFIFTVYSAGTLFLLISFNFLNYQFWSFPLWLADNLPSTLAFYLYEWINWQMTLIIAIEHFFFNIPFGSTFYQFIFHPLQTMLFFLPAWILNVFAFLLLVWILLLWTIITYRFATKTFRRADTSIFKQTSLVTKWIVAVPLSIALVLMISLAPLALMGSGGGGGNQDDVYESPYNPNPDTHKVDPYYRSDGTPVQGHNRSNPDEYKSNNLNE